MPSFTLEQVGNDLGVHRDVFVKEMTAKGFTRESALSQYHRLKRQEMYLSSCGTYQVSVEPEFHQFGSAAAMLAISVRRY